MKEKWLFIDSGDCTPAFNMALDESLISWHSKELIPPVVRFYGWEPAGLSLGYFQKTKGKIDIETAKKHGCDIVRRLTGGRAVLHDDELTYSVIVSEKHPDMPKSVAEAYKVISEGLLQGFRALNIHAEFAVPDKQTASTNSAVCFDEPSWYELLVEGKKAAGSAQTRQKGVILQHGSIPINVDENKLFDMFIYPSDRARERAQRGFGSKAAAINQLLNEKVSLDHVKRVFKNTFEEALGVDFLPYSLTADQLQEVRELAETRYSNDDWTYSR